MSTDQVSRAFGFANREAFLPPEVRNLAGFDTALPIAGGQTNSQPYTVKQMLKWLAVEPGDKVLDIGSGSGWTTALLSYLTGEHGEVIAVERVPELVKFGKKNCQKLGINNATFKRAGKHLGHPADAPYNRILVSASAPSLPTSLIGQLANGGRLVIPVKNSIFVIDKDKAGNISQKEHPGFVFVPLISEG